MVYLLVRHKNKDYEKWKTVFDGHGATRKTSGSKGGRIFRNADNPNEMVIIFEWDSLERARKFAQLQDLKTPVRSGIGIREV